MLKNLQADYFLTSRFFFHLAVEGLATPKFLYLCDVHIAVITNSL